MAQFTFFPSPYSDEVLYSVLCRYHARSCNPGMNTTVKELWGYKGATKSLYLPTGLDAIMSKLPKGTGITLDNLIWDHTMYPYVRPVLPRSRADLLYEMLCGTEKNCSMAYQEAGLIGRRLPLPRYLRFCPSCVIEDDKIYGEAYWHRVHQLPGVYICQKHNEYIRDSKYFTHMIFRYFFPANTELCVNLPRIERFPEKLEEQLLRFAEDSEWLLKNGGLLGTLENLFEKHCRLLVYRGLRGYSSLASTDYRTLHDKIYRFYGKDFLETLNAYDEDAYHGWPTTLTYRNVRPPTSHYLLMMRFLAGSPKQFFESEEQFRPFGEEPWPCRNLICEYNLKDCIEQIEINVIGGQHKAVFTCPHCGFSYRRGKATSKEQQYAGQVKVVDFGWLWKETLKNYLFVRKFSVHRTAKLMQTSDDNVLIHGIKMGLLPESRMPHMNKGTYTEGRIYVREKPESTVIYRKRWLKLIEDNPNCNRSELARKDLKIYKWMLYNDYEWFDEHTPKPICRRINWELRDQDCLERAIQAISDLFNTSGRPQWISYYAVGKMIAAGNGIYQIINKLPKTKQYLESIVETKDEWRRRKIQWAINALFNEGVTLSTYQVRVKSGISSKVFELLREYTENEMKTI